MCLYELKVLTEDHTLLHTIITQRSEKKMNRTRTKIYGNSVSTVSGVEVPINIRQICHRNPNTSKMIVRCRVELSVTKFVIHLHNTVCSLLSSLCLTSVYSSS